MRAKVAGFCVFSTDINYNRVVINNKTRKGIKMKFRIWNGEKMLPWDKISHLSACEIFSCTADKIVMPSTEEEDISGEEIYAGDIIENPNGVRMEIFYGTYQAYCPADGCYMESIGFYAEGLDLPQMPVGPLADYAKVIGNIHENPDLIDK